jgi:hypothetical protein
VIERRLVEVLDQVVIARPFDLLWLLPPELPERFTTADLALALKRPRRVAQHVAYCLARTAVLEADGKRGHAIVYRIAAR